MKRRSFLGGAIVGGTFATRAGAADLCGCSLMPQAIRADGPDPFERVGSGVKITGMKVYGVSLTPQSDRPYVFVKLETNKGVVGWGEGTLEGKAAAVMSCIEDFREFLIGKDPLQVEHHWQSMYVHSFYRAGPVIGSAIAGIDQALWDIRGKVLGMPVYKLLGGPVDPRGVRGYYHTRARNLDELRKLRETAVQQGVSCFKTGIPGYYEWIDSHKKIDAAVKGMQMAREGLGPDIDIGVDFHAKTSPSVASVIVKEVEPLNLLFIEEPCPPENVAAMARIAKRSTTPIATGERLVAHYGVQQICEQGVVDIIQTDINHVGGITALWKVGQMAALSGISMAPHACEGPIGGLATVHVDAATPNFLIQEICSGVTVTAQEEAWAEWLGFPVMRMVNGRFPLPEKPGLGFEMNEKALAKYPFGGTKPMARVFHEDGSVAEW
ncbi:MAG TPA: galactonate dehydratase [Bryobacteraceae bacterium]|jgi:galactonate dehydratase|nr:galactonate dehydratase [Bryobacteraceae bacterium]